LAEALFIEGVAMLQPLPQFVIPILVSLTILSFGAWMFRDMVANDEIPGEAKPTCTFAFVFLSLFAAIFYYVNVYRHRH
jgi:hypothetical protein